MPQPFDNESKSNLTDFLIGVLLPLPFNEPFTYRLALDENEQSAVTLGAYVIVPFGKSEKIGVIWSLNAAASVPLEKVKPLTRLIAVPPMDEHLRTFIEWVSRYTLQPLGLILKQALTIDSAREAPTQTVYQAASHVQLAPHQRLTPLQEQLYEKIKNGEAHTLTEWTKKLGCSAATLNRLRERRLLVAHTQTRDDAFVQPSVALSPITLSPSQQQATNILVADVMAARFHVNVLEGVTGSGKTEVFCEAVRAALRAQQQVLVLMPEIALSVQMLERFERLLGITPVAWHSDLSSSARRKAWRAIAQGEVRLVIGARSALFLPFKNLGLIVVDEEHEGAYKQEEGVNYHARDMAVVRASLLNVPIILCSATPSIETVVNVKEGRYHSVSLPERHAGAALPAITLVDLLKNKLPRGRWLAEPTLCAIQETLTRKEQVLLFLNRRGYAPLTLCRTCGFRLMCPHCTAWMVEHRLGEKAGFLQCHHCGYRQKNLQTCPQCNDKESFVACGPGVERLEEEVAQLFPDAKRLIVTSDTLTSWKCVQDALHKMSEREYDIMIGTQIVAKGHHFPYLTLVVVVDADLGLDGGDMRAAERTFQILQQVSGRAGRAEHPGSVILQTHCVDNFIFSFLQKNDREGFLEHEIEIRQTHHWPPFSRLAALIVSGKNLINVEKAAKEIRIKWPELDGVEIFGPSPAPLAKLKDDHRMRLLVRCDRGQKIQTVLIDALSTCRLPKGVDLKIVIDPFTFL